MNTSLSKPRVVRASLLLFAFTRILHAGDIYWTNTAGGFWSAATNWSPNTVPGASDNAFIVSNGNYTVALDLTTTVSNLAIGGTSGTQTFSNANRTLTLYGDSLFDSHAVVVWSGGTLAGGGLLTVNGVLNWMAGSLNGALTVASNGMMNITGTSVQYLRGAVTNWGTVISAQSGSGELRFNAGGVLVNTASGLFDLQGDRPVDNTSGTGAEYFLNLGTVRRSTGTGTATVSVTLTNLGSVEAQTGTLYLSGGGLMNGGFSAIAGATLRFGGTWTMQPSAQFSGAGTVSIYSGATTYSGPGIQDLSHLLLNSGTFVADGPVTNLTMSGGTLSGNGTLSGTINMNSGTLGGTKVLSGTLNWNSGSLSGTLTLASNATLNVTGAGIQYVRGALTNWGTMVCAQSGSGVIRLNLGGFIINETSGLLDWQTDRGLDDASGTGTEYFLNLGELRKSVGTGNTTISTPLTNHGFIAAQSGVLYLAGGGLMAGEFSAATGATLRFGGTWTMQSSAEFGGAGTVSINSGTTTYSDAANKDLSHLLLDSGTLVAHGPITNLVMSGGTLAGDGDLSGVISQQSGTMSGTKTLSGILNWTSGSLNGTLTVASNGLINVVGSSIQYVRGALTNWGTVVCTQSVSSALRLNAGGYIVNAPSGLFDFQTDRSLDATSGTGSEFFLNQGMLRKSAATGTSSISVTLTNLGSVTAQSGNFYLSGGGLMDGTCTALSGAKIRLGGSWTVLPDAQFVGAGTIAIYSGITSYAGPAVKDFSNLLLDSGTFMADGPITNVTIAGGTLSGNGSLAGTINLTSGTLGGNKVLTGTLNWPAGTLEGSLTVASNGVVSITGTTFQYVRGVLTNWGSILLAPTISGVLRLNQSGAIVNETSGLFDCQSDHGLDNTGGSGAEYFLNQGLVRKSAGTGTTTLSAPFTNLGNVAVQSGTLYLSGGGQMAGSFDAAAGATLRFGGNWTLLAGTQFSGAGTIEIYTGNVNFAGPVFDFGTLSQRGGTLTVNGPIAAFTMSGGTLVGNGPITNLTMSGGTLAGYNQLVGLVDVSGGTLGGTNLLAGTLNWSGGNQSGELTVASNALLSFTGSTIQYLRGAVTNWGTMVFAPATGGALRLNLGGYIVNETSGLFDCQTDRTLDNTGGSGAEFLLNAGLLRKSGGTGTTSISVSCTNQGSVAVQSGTLYLSDGGVMGGSFDAAAGATLRFGGNWMLLPGAQFSGAGTIEIYTGNVNFAGPVFDFGTLSQRGGTLTVNGPIAAFTMTGGTLVGNGPITNLTMSGGTLAGYNELVGLVDMSGGTLGGTNLLEGTFNWSGGNQSGQLTVASNALVNFTGSTIQYLRGVVTNWGTIIFAPTTGGALRLNLGGYIVNKVSGLLDFQTDRVMDNTAGTGAEFVLNEGLVRKSAGTGTTTAAIRFINLAVLEPRIGTLRFTRTLELPPSSVLSIPIGGTAAGVDFGVINATTFPLGGMLAVSLANGFVPGAGDSFQILKWNRKLGGFNYATGLDLGNGLYFQGIADKYELSLVTKTTIVPTPPPPTNLVDQVVAFGDNAVFAFSPPGVEPFTYQWRFYGTNLPGQTFPSLIILNVQAANLGPYCAVVTDAFGITRTNCANLSALTAPGIVTQPVGLIATNGANITLTTSGSGSGPLKYQWRINGENIPGATRSSYTITNAQPTDGGIYSVLVANSVRVVASSEAQVLVQTNDLPFGDDFAVRGSISDFGGTGSGNNTNATHETGEPGHAGKPGTHSLWLEWTAPANGVATFSTRGSAFDTLLGVYTGTSVSNLTLVASDDDRGDYFTSEAAFNATNGGVYEIAVAGLRNAAGDIILSWNLDTNITQVPRIIQAPLDATASAGANANFSVFAVSATNLSYQWFFGGWLAIPDATNATLTIEKVSYLDVGTYSVQVTAAGQSVESLAASLELGPEADSHSFNKLDDLLTDQARAGERFVLAKFNGGALPLSLSFPSVSVGSIGSQIINNFNSTTQQGEPIHSDVIGGASRWYQLTAVTNGTLVIDTMGSDIKTVLAVYTGSDLFSLVKIASDRNSAPDGLHSLVNLSAVAGTRYLIAVDGVNGAHGNINLNWRMGVPPGAAPPPQNLVLTIGAPLVLQAGDGSGGSSPRYQWRRNGENIAGATNSTYSLASLRYDQVGSYSVAVSNLVGGVINAIATVSAQSPLSLGLDVDGFRLSGSSTQATLLQLSTNLTQWSPVYTNISPLLPVDYVDTNSFKRAKGFYRLKPWP